MVDVEAKEWVLTALDRCDGKDCGAQAYVLIKGVSGELMFCSHHFNKTDGDKLRSFAFEVIDERERLIQNRTQGDD